MASVKQQQRPTSGLTSFSYWQHNGILAINFRYLYIYKTLAFEQPKKKKSNIIIQCFVLTKFLPRNFSISFLNFKLKKKEHTSQYSKTETRDMFGNISILCRREKVTIRSKQQGEASQINLKQNLFVFARYV